jgi:hypothetical protein
MPQKLVWRTSLSHQNLPTAQAESVKSAIINVRERKSIKRDANPSAKIKLDDARRSSSKSKRRLSTVFRKKIVLEKFLCMFFHKKRSLNPRDEFNGEDKGRQEDIFYASISRSFLVKRL